MAAPPPGRPTLLHRDGTQPDGQGAGSDHATAGGQARHSASAPGNLGRPHAPPPRQPTGKRREPAMKGRAARRTPQPEQPEHPTHSPQSTSLRSVAVTPSFPYNYTYVRLGLMFSGPYHNTNSL